MPSGPLGPTVPFVDEVPDYVIRDNNMHIRVRGECLCCMSLRTFREGMARAIDVLREHDHGRVVAFPGTKPKRGKADKD